MVENYVFKNKKTEKKRYLIFMMIGLFFVGMLISSIDHPLSFPIGIIIGIYGVALSPINEKTVTGIVEYQYNKSLIRTE